MAFLAPLVPAIMGGLGSAASAVGGAASAAGTGLASALPSMAGAGGLGSAAAIPTGMASGSLTGVGSGLSSLGSTLSGVGSSIIPAGGMSSSLSGLGSGATTLGSTATPMSSIVAPTSSATPALADVGMSAAPQTSAMFGQAPAAMSPMSTGDFVAPLTMGDKVGSLANSAWEGIKDNPMAALTGTKMASDMIAPKPGMPGPQRQAPPPVAPRQQIGLMPMAKMNPTLDWIKKFGGIGLT